MSLITFVLAFFLLLIVVVGMSVGVMVKGRTIKGSCGGLNAIEGADKCVVCQKDIDPDSPLRDKLQCKRKRQISEQMATQ
ncbi:MAG: (Na+)-NQR maturation NqrM [Rhodobacteraceae bacterium]|nr:(Na+)-NQR maturation NqrM [Paracoccaceae bacterium]MCW9041797.1 (Na+)-NQR maturation NqrM [Pseudopelagicola sp.]